MPPLPPPPFASAGKILVVDDVPENLAVLVELLGGAGFEVLVAESGDIALAQLPGTRPELVLLDVLMPGLDGFEVCRRLKADPLHADLPVIFMTALTDTVDKVTGFAAGAVDWVSKPVDPDEVLARVQAHLQLRRLRRELAARNRELEHEVRRRREAEAQLGESLDQAVLVAGLDGGIRFATRHASELLRRHFPEAAAEVLPPALAAWCAAGEPEEFQHAGAGGQLVVRLFAGARRDGPAMLLLEEKFDIPDATALRQLGLTPREAEVLFWLAQGKTSPEIGIILGSAAGTVKKHVHSIFEKLEVDTRTAAAVRALEILGLPPRGV